MIKLAVVTSHPIQYQAPWFRALAQVDDLDLEVLFCHRATPREQAEAGFGVEFDWDVCLLDGYRHRFLRNVAKAPSVNNFFGLDTPGIEDILSTQDYDAVLVSGWHYKSAWQAILTCWRRKMPVMVRGDSHLHTRRSAWKRLVKSAPYRWFIRKFDACLAVGRWSREYFLHYGAKPERIFFVPHAVDERIFGEDAGRRSGRSNLRARWGLGETGPVFLFAGKFVRKKRPMDFVKAIGRVLERGLGVQALMAGDGPLRSLCEQWARSEGLPIRFAGFLNQSDMVDAYYASDVLVLPSDGEETWGLVVNEAMNCGLPAIVSDRVGAGPDLVIPGQTGYTFSCGDVAALADLMAWYARNPDQAKVMGEKARQRVSLFSTAAAVEGVLEALEAVCGRWR